MSLRSWFLARLYKLPRRQSRARRIRDVRVKMPDGVELATELFLPELKGEHPTLLIREPYGLSSFAVVAEVFAERGYNVVLQACRGTDKSGGEFEPLANERSDGLATLDWIKERQWFDGRLGTTGPSYLGYAQWAISDALPKRAAMAIAATSAEFKSIVFPGGGFHLGLWLSWMQTIEGLKGNMLRTARRMFTGGIERSTLRASMKLPLKDADRRVTGHNVGFWDRWLSNAVGNDEFWRPIDHTHRIGPRTAPTSFTSGWYDFMLDQLLRDYATMVETGHTPQLTIGPWTHVAPDLQKQSVLDTFTLMDAELRDDRTGLRDNPVRIHISGLDEWREYQSFPPGPTDSQIWHLHPDKVLSLRPVRASPPDTYTYDPADPTPAVGGAMFAFVGAGPLDNAPLEKRADVLTYTSEPLFNPVCIVGNVRVTLYARSSLTNTDFFVRLCDVDEKGLSINICDGLIRKSSADPAVADDIWKITFKLHTSAHLFRRDHRLRVLVASGAHPRFARNTGTDEPLGSATTLATADIEIFHDPNHPSTITLPVFELEGIAGL